jgi:hypothetical protein
VQETLITVEAADSNEILGEVHLDYVENADAEEGMCSCVCIHHEKCCGCLLQ